MKKVLFVVAAALVSTGAFAQSFSYGVKAGVNFAKETKMDDMVLPIGDDEYLDMGDTKMRTGFHVGVVGEYTFNDFIGLQAELLYSQMGAKWKTTYEGFDVKLTDKADYLTLPVMAKLYLYEGLSLEVGPQFGYMLSGKMATDVDGETDDNSYYDEDDLNKFDVSAALGLSYRFAFGLDVSARYNLGFTDTKKIVGEKVKNNVIAVSVGYRF